MNGSTDEQTDRSAPKVNCVQFALLLTYIPYLKYEAHTILEEER